MNSQMVDNLTIDNWKDFFCNESGESWPENISRKAEVVIHAFGVVKIDKSKKRKRGPSEPTAETAESRKERKARERKIGDQIKYILNDETHGILPRLKKLPGVTVARQTPVKNHFLGIFYINFTSREYARYLGELCRNYGEKKKEGELITAIKYRYDIALPALPPQPLLDGKVLFNSDHVYQSVLVKEILTHWYCYKLCPEMCTRLTLDGPGESTVDSLKTYGQDMVDIINPPSQFMIKPENEKHIYVVDDPKMEAMEAVLLLMPHQTTTKERAKNQDSVKSDIFEIQYNKDELKKNLENCSGQHGGPRNGFVLKFMMDKL